MLGSTTIHILLHEASCCAGARGNVGTASPRATSPHPAAWTPAFILASYRPPYLCHGPTQADTARGGEAGAPAGEAQQACACVA